MAYLPQDENLDERLRQAAEQQGQLLSGQSGTITQSPMSGDTNNPPVRAGGNQFANIGQYLAQNDAAELAKKASSKIEEAGNSAKNAIKSLEDDYKNKVEQGSVRFNQDLVNRAINDPLKLTEEEREQIKKMREGSYRGPQDISDLDQYADTVSKVNTARILSNFATSAEGRSQLAKDITTGRRATGGVVGLNNLLLSSSPEARAKLQQVADSNSDLEQRLAAVRSTAADLAQRSDRDTQETSLKTKNALTDAIQSLDTDLANRVTSERERLAAKDKNMKDLLLYLSTYSGNQDQGKIQEKVTDSKKVPDDDIFNPKNLTNLLGISKDEGENLLSTISKARNYGIDNFNFDPYIVRLASESDVSKKSVITADEYARLQALSDLAGVDPILDEYGFSISSYSGFKYKDAVKQLNDLINMRKKI